MHALARLRRFLNIYVLPEFEPKFLIYFNLLYFYLTKANSANPDQTPQNAMSDLGIHSFKIKIKIKKIFHTTNLNLNFDLSD